MTTVSEGQAKSLDAMGNLTEIFPYLFANGSELTGIVGSCSSCCKTISAENTKAEVVLLTEHALSINAYGLCYCCKIITPMKLTFADDGTYLAKADNGWRPGRYAAEKQSGLMNRIKVFFGIGGGE